MDNKKTLEPETQEQNLKIILNNIKWLKIIMFLICVSNIVQLITSMFTNKNLEITLEIIDKTLKLLIGM